MLLRRLKNEVSPARDSGELWISSVGSSTSVARPWRGWQTPPRSGRYSKEWRGIFAPSATIHVQGHLIEESPQIESAALLADRQLVTAMLARDRKAAAEFVQRLSDPLVHYIRSRMQPRWEEVDDLVQETFLTALRSLPSYRGDSPLRAWVLGIARHKVEDHYRQRIQRVVLPEESIDIEMMEDPGLDELLDKARAEARTESVLRTLPEQYRIVLLWRYWEQRSATEMSTLSGKTVKSLERLLSRARQEFREQWRNQRKEER